MQRDDAPTLTSKEGFEPLTLETEKLWREECEADPGLADFGGWAMLRVFATIDAERARVRELECDLEAISAYIESETHDLSGSLVDKVKWLHDGYVTCSLSALARNSLAAEMAEALEKARVSVLTWSPNPTEPLADIDAALARYRAQAEGEKPSHAATDVIAPPADWLPKNTEKEAT